MIIRIEVAPSCFITWEWRLISQYSTEEQVRLSLAGSHFRCHVCIVMRSFCSTHLPWIPAMHEPHSCRSLHPRNTVQRAHTCLFNCRLSVTELLCAVGGDWEGETLLSDGAYKLCWSVSAEIVKKKKIKKNILMLSGLSELWLAHSGALQIHMLHSVFAFDGADAALDGVSLCFFVSLQYNISISLCIHYLYWAFSLFISSRNAESLCGKVTKGQWSAGKLPLQQ